MKHNQFNHNFSFYKSPVNFNKFSDKSLLQYCLGATLYMPGTKNVLDKILNKNFDNLTSMVMDFEDALEESKIAIAEQNVLDHLTMIHEAVENGELSIDDLPLIFLRVRNTTQFASFALKLQKQHAIVLTGFVFPKFYSHNAADYLNQLKKLNQKFNTKLYGMPILEGRSIANKETRL
jgi:citrate lyase beta subunit